MSAVRHLSIRAKIFLSYLAMLVLTLVVSSVSWAANESLAIRAHQIHDDHLQSVIQLANTESALWELRWGLAQFIVTNEDERQAILAAQDKWYRKIERNMAAYTSTIHTHNDDLLASQSLLAWQDAYPKYAAARPRWFQLMEEGRLEEAATWRAETTTKYGKRAVMALNDLITLEQSEAARAKDYLSAVETSSRTSIIGVSALVLVIGLGAGTVLAYSITRPVRAMTQAARAAGAGDLEVRVPVTAHDELGVLGRTFNQMIGEIANARQTLEDQVHERTVDLMTALTEVEAYADNQTRLLEKNTRQQIVIRDLMAPVIPVLPGVLVVPLIGSIDSARATTITSRVLEAVVGQHARQLILDITGVPVVDTQVAQVLLDLATAVRLLGACVALVGIRPEVAQTIIGLGLNFDTLKTFADLQTVIAQLTRQGSITSLPCP